MAEKHKLTINIAENTTWKNVTFWQEFSQPLKKLDINEINILKYAYHKVLSV